jgi:2'-5' RNA ligase
MANIRTFIGVQVPTRVVNNVSRVINKLDATGASYNWVVPENLHVTLNFAGDILDREVHELCGELKRAIEVHEPFELSLNGVNGFPNAQQPRVLWIGVDEGADSLASLNRDIENTLSDWGINKDRNAYTPHMTLGRLKKAGRWNEKMLDVVHRHRNHDGGTCSIDTVTVFSSFLDPGGPSYTPMARVKLLGDFEQE